MAIPEKPNKKSKETNSIDEHKAMSFISKGGKTTQEEEEPEEVKKEGVLVRMYPDVIEDIDKLIKKIPKRYRPTRTGWIIQAIEEKLKRDKKDIK